MPPPCPPSENNRKPPKAASQASPQAFTQAEKVTIFLSVLPPITNQHQQREYSPTVKKMDSINTQVNYRITRSSLFRASHHQIAQIVAQSTRRKFHRRYLHGLVPSKQSINYVYRPLAIKRAESCELAHKRSEKPENRENTKNSQRSGRHGRSGEKV